MKAALMTLAAALALLFGATNARSAAHPHAPIMGVVSHAPLAHLARRLSSAVHGTATCGTAGCAAYESEINQYFTDVAADNGKTTNVYSTDTQYSDATGPIAYNSTFGGSYVDTNAFPASQCNDGVNSVCLVDQQIENEIQNVISAKGWPTGQTSLFFIMLPQGVGDCTDSNATQCSTNFFCAYHSGFVGSDTNPVLYAVEPYDHTIPGCNDGNSPNGNDADATINTISHEHNEAITDPWGNAWLDSNQQEIGDLCAWMFGAVQGSTANGQYNQVINGHDYWLQEEYSNAGVGCVQNFGGIATTITGGPLALFTPSCSFLVNACWVMRTNTVYTIYWMPNGAPTNTAPPVVSGAAAFGQNLTTSTGTWVGSPASYAYQWQHCAADGTGCTDIPGATSSTYHLTAADVGQRVRSEVSATNASGTSPPAVAVPSNLVVPALATTVSPSVSGTPAVGRTLATTEGTWNTSADSYAYQWLRCAANGTSCVTIAGATLSTYRVASADVGHALEARVTATNAAGSTAAFSAPTGAVVATPKALKAPAISGHAKVGKTLKAATGSWSGGPTKFHFAWLRCRANGSHCSRIGGATHETYRLTAHDAGHRLRVQVTASGPAGSSSVTSGATARVKR